MKKITTSAILALILGTLSTEADSSIYIGLEQSLSYRVKNTAKIGSYYKESNTESPTITSIKIGGINGDIKSGDRYEFQYNFGDKSANPVEGLNGKDIMSLNLHYNLTLPSISPIEELLPYIRLGGAYLISNKKYKDYSTGEKYNYKAVGVLLGVGAYYILTDNISVASGFDYGYRTWDDLEYYNSYYGSTTVKSEDTFSKLYVGVDYLF